MKISLEAAQTAPHNTSEFDILTTAVQNHFNAMVASSGPALFRVAPRAHLFELFLDMLPAGEQQAHRCNCCRQFIQNFGDLAVIAHNGLLVSAVWPTSLEGIPEIYHDALRNMARAVNRGKVIGVQVWDRERWGTAHAGGWNHFSLAAPPKNHNRRDLTAEQVAAQKLEDFRTLRHGLGEFRLELVEQAVTLLEADQLFQGEKFLPPARFLLDLHRNRRPVHGEAQDNFVWQAVATAPEGFCRPRSTMIGTLLEDLQRGLPIATVKRKFAEKVAPLAYMRPKAPPTTGNIKQAEDLFQRLGLAASLERRYARLEELELLWVPAAARGRHQKPDGAETPGGSIFGHLQPKVSSPVHARAPVSSIPTVRTWEKFARDVLPGALKIEVQANSQHMFCAYVTATDPLAPPVLQWDHDDRRNPVSWYVYPHGSSAPEWGLDRHEWHEVTGISLKPSEWHGNPSSYQGALLVLRNCRDTGSPGLGLFPALLKSDLHAVRATIEAFSKSRRLTGRQEATACGINIGKNGDMAILKVTSDTGQTLYRIDRWD